LASVGLSVTVSLFTRGVNESVRITRHDRADGEVIVQVDGPGGRSERLLFLDMATAVLDHSAREARLVAAGFRLESFTTERRRSTHHWHPERRNPR
jgi:hypothetical protein